jgi:hypothetical protein
MNPIKLLILTTSLLLLEANSSQAADSPAKRLNVLFIAVDDLRCEFNAYGADYIHAPNLDRIAKRGLTFNRAYCQQAVCMASRASLMTGARTPREAHAAVAGGSGWSKTEINTHTTRRPSFFSMTFKSEIYPPNINQE